ncbi:MAG: sugar phosphate isomerase/epimerase [Solirubrobacteraceae bacterium]|nr:sugar phosphate isomerase/epimerase [Solirubrobacteraceae bacterium]
MIREPHDLAARLGLNVPREQWPQGRVLAEYAGAGFRWVQFHAPPRPVLREPAQRREHARALRALLDPTGLRLVLHAPDDLSAGTPEGDRIIEALLDYAAEAGAELLAYHALNFPDLGGREAKLVRERAAQEEQSLAHLLRRAQTLDVTVALENLAPVFAGTRRLSHDPLAVRDLVRRLDEPAAGMLLDLGHLHVTAEGARESEAEIAAACAPDVVLFHVHDNFGARRHDVQAPGVDPLRLDLHLAPGAGTLAWPRLAEVAGRHTAPLLLEVQPQHRPVLWELQATTAALLTPAAEERLAA